MEPTARPRRRGRRRVRLALGVVVLACLSVVVVGARQGQASPQIPVIPPFSSPQIYVAGAGASALQPFASDSLTAGGTALTGTASAVADTVNGALTIALGTVTSTATVMDAETGLSLGSISFPQAPVSVAADPDPANPDLVYAASNNSLYVANLADLPSVTAETVYTLPTVGPLAGDTFNSLAVAPGGSMIYLGGAQLACVPGYGGCTQQYVNAVFAISPSSGGPCPTPQALTSCEWVAPFLSAGVTTGADYYGHISGVAVTPNGQDLFATNDPYNLDAAGNLIGNGVSLAYGFQLSPTSAPPTGPFASSGALGAQVELPDAAETGGADHAYTTGALTISPDGRDVYVASETFTVCCGLGSAEVWLTGFPVAALRFPPVTTPPPNAPSVTVELQPDYGPEVSIAMSPDGKTLVTAMASTGASGSPGSLVDAIPVMSSGPGVQIAPIIDGFSCSTGTTCVGPAPAPSPQTTFLPTGVSGSPQGIAITPDRSPVPSFTYQPGVAGTPSAFNASASSVQFGTIQSYNWSFGDGGGPMSLGPTPTHVFNTCRDLQRSAV